MSFIPQLDPLSYSYYEHESASSLELVWRSRDICPFKGFLLSKFLLVNLPIHNTVDSTAVNFETADNTSGEVSNC